MSDDEDLLTEASDEEEDDDLPESDALEGRGEELVGRQEVVDACLDLYKDVERGFQDQWERSNSQIDYWDIYNCELGSKQFYAGNSKIFAPIVRDAVNARKTRFVNQVFPQSGKHVEVSASEEKPTAIMSLLEHYIRKLKLRTKMMPKLVKNGDVEGQYNVYLGWRRTERHVVRRVKSKAKIDDVEIEGEEFDDVEEETLVHQGPVVEVLSDADVLVLPHTADDIEQAVDDGGSVTVLRRWSKAKIRRMIRDGDVDKEEGTALLKEMAAFSKNPHQPDKKGHMVDAAGIHSSGKGGLAVAFVYETWAKMKVDEDRRIVRVYFGGERRVLSCKRNPHWCDKVPVLSGAVEELEGAFKGQSKIKPVETYQYLANDAINEGMDAAAYALLPIIMTDPEKNPRVGSMVLNVAAIWETSPKDTKFANFPPLWKDAFNIVNAAKDQIFQTLGVNPAMMPQAASGKKTNQAQIAAEQQVDILTTADAVTTLEGEILSPMLQWFLWLDHQHRNTAITLREFGPMGVQVEMERIEPIQMDRRFEFRWYGVEAARNQQQVQMQLAGLNTLRGIQPQYYPGHEINLVPVISQFVENLFGPRLGAQVFTDVRKKLTLNPGFENQMLEAGFVLPVHPMDEDQEHMQEHMRAFQEVGDLHGTIREHMVYHQMQMQQKQQASQMQQAQQAQGAQGTPGGQGPGVAGTPRQGAVPRGPRANGQGPPGMIHRDQMRNAMPRQRGPM